MESHHRIEARRSEDPRHDVLAVLSRSASCLLLAGLLVGCTTTTPVDPEPLPQPTPQPKPDAPKEDGKGWKPVTG